jgi:hypothetical protein
MGRLKPKVAIITGAAIAKTVARSLLFGTNFAEFEIFV